MLTSTAHVGHVPALSRVCMTPGITLSPDLKASGFEGTPGGNLVSQAPEYCVPGESITRVQARMTKAHAIAIHLPTARGVAGNLIIGTPWQR
jgi:hypothetical protein